MTINMTPQEKIDKEIWWALQAIREQQLRYHNEENVYFTFLPSTDGINPPYPRYQLEVLEKLKTKGIINFDRPTMEPISIAFDPGIYRKKQAEALENHPEGWQVIMSVNKEAFEQLYEEYEKKYGEPLLEKTDKKTGRILLQIGIVKFNDEKASIEMKEDRVELPPNKNEHCLCRVMFNRPAGIPLDWSEVYEEMTGKDFFEKDKKSNRRSVYDAYLAVNSRVKEGLNTDQELFTWKDKTIKRNY